MAREQCRSEDYVMALMMMIMMLMTMMMSGDPTRGQRPGAACEGRRPEVVATRRARGSESPPRTAAQYHTSQSVNINMWKYKMLPDSCSLMFAPAALLRCHSSLFTTILNCRSKDIIDHIESAVLCQFLYIKSRQDVKRVTFANCIYFLQH